MMWYSFERGKTEAGGWKLEIRKKLRRRSAEKMDCKFEWFCGLESRDLVTGSRRKERINTEHTEVKRHREHKESFEWCCGPKVEAGPP